MPSPVVDRAGRLLRDLERERARGQGPQLSLFGVDPSSAQEDTEAEAAPSEVNAIAEALDQLDPDSMSPRDALEALYKLKELTE
jgi:DNA mismatch repair protein MutS